MQSTNTPTSRLSGRPSNERAAGAQRVSPALIALKVVGGSACLIGIGLAFFFRDRFAPKRMSAA